MGRGLVQGYLCGSPIGDALVDIPYPPPPIWYIQLTPSIQFSYDPKDVPKVDETSSRRVTFNLRPGQRRYIDVYAYDYAGASPPFPPAYLAGPSLHELVHVSGPARSMPKAKWWNYSADELAKSFGDLWESFASEYPCDDFCWDVTNELNAMRARYDSLHDAKERPEWPAA